jgi:diguanylate cyclase (GGDEF)-like protein
MMPDNTVKARKPSWRSRPLLSIRARLIVLAVLAITPLVFERMHGLEAARVQRTERARSEVIDLASRGTESQREIIYSVRALLQIVARIYARMPVDPPECNQYLTALTGNVPWIQGLAVAGIDGRIVCGTRPDAIGLNVSDRPHFQQALHSRDFALSDYLIDRTHQVPGLIATFPAVKDDGSVNAVVLAAINLQWIGDLVATAAQRSGASVLLLDGGGTLIAASADEEKLIGRRFSDDELAKEILTHDEGTMTAPGFDGVQRIFAYARVPWTQARLAVGLDENAVQSGVDREIGIAYLQLALFGLFVLLVAWFGGEQLIVRPIRSLVRTAARFGRGDLHVRATQQSWIAEFEPLAVALDDMARKLAAREEELRIVNEHLDELASLDGLTGLANRRGFDRQIELEWRRADQSREPLALMMIDIDHFKLYNDRYGHVPGDTCLRSVGETLSLVTLETAVLVARYGGEEFALLLPGLDLQRATALAEEARRSVEELFITNAEAPCGIVTVSIGVEAMVPTEAQTAADLVEAADGALYAAKRGGRNRVVAHARTLVSGLEQASRLPRLLEVHPPLVA